MSRGPRQRQGPLNPSSSSPSRDVPTGIKIVAALNVLGALLALPLIGRILSMDHRLAGVIAFALSLFILAILVATYGLVTLKRWGWVGSLGLNGLSVLLALLRGASQTGGADLGGVLVSGAIIIYLLTVGEYYAE